MDRFSCSGFPHLLLSQVLAAVLIVMVYRHQLWALLFKGQGGLWMGHEMDINSQLKKTSTKKHWFLPENI